jgi:hypothetical protein
MTPLRQRMIKAMQLRGLSARTQESYLGAIQQLALHYRKPPDLLTETKPLGKTCCRKRPMKVRAGRVHDRICLVSPSR